MDAQAKTIVIVGPTAGGKTELSLLLAEHLRAVDGCAGGECICADSMQVYRGMDIGTAKPTPAEQARAPHHLLDLIDPSDDGFSVDAWLRLANDARRSIAERGAVPIVVGGTNLYIQALLHGMFDGPEPDETLRAALNAMDLAQLRARLEEVDPESAMRLHINDRKRAVRAIEVYELTGQPISELQRQWSAHRTTDDLFMLGLDYPPDMINRRINARVRQMMERGLVDEVEALWQGGRLGRQASEALGYKQIIDALAGRCSMDEAVEQIKIRTRRYARKQRTWLKRFRIHRPGQWLGAGDFSAQQLCQQALEVILPWLDRSSSGNSPGAAGRCGGRDSA